MNGFEIKKIPHDDDGTENEAVEKGKKSDTKLCGMMSTAAAAVAVAAAAAYTHTN